MIFIEYVDMTKIIHARNVEIVCNMKLRPCLQISGSGSEFLVLDLDSWSLNTGSWTLDFETQILGPKSGFLVLGLGSPIPQSVDIITKWKGKSLKVVAAITKWERKLSQSYKILILITSKGRAWKVMSYNTTYMFFFVNQYLNSYRNK